MKQNCGYDALKWVSDNSQLIIQILLFWFSYENWKRKIIIIEFCILTVSTKARMCWNAFLFIVQKWTNRRKPINRSYNHSMCMCLLMETKQKKILTYNKRLNNQSKKKKEQQHRKRRANKSAFWLMLEWNRKRQLLRRIYIRPNVNTSDRNQREKRKKIVQFECKNPLFLCCVRFICWFRLRLVCGQLI